MERPDSYIPQINRVKAGIDDKGPGYATWRSSGTTDWLLLHPISGRGRLGTSLGYISARPGDTFLIRPGTFHDYSTDGAVGHWCFHWAHFHPRADWRALMDWPQVAEGVFRVHSSGEIDRQICSLLTQAGEFTVQAQHGHPRSELFAQNLLEAVLLRCDSLNHQKTVFDDRILRALDAVARRTSAPLTVAELARISNMSVSRFAHLFREQVGVAPGEYIESVRIAQAAQLLLTTTRPISEIALETGFTNPLYFSTRFRQYKGRSPRQYRQNPPTDEDREIPIRRVVAHDL